MEALVVEAEALVEEGLVEAGNMYLTNDEKNKISQEIENLEKQSSAELVAVITKQSSSYDFEILVISTMFTLLISIIILLIGDISAKKMFQWQFISFFSLYFILYKFKTLIFKILPKKYKYKKVAEYAKKLFLNLGFQTTKTKQAIMFFVSIEEKYVEIITDSEIKQKIEDSYWQDIVDAFIIDVKNRQFAKGYLKAINSCQEILIKNFPIQDNDENELSNEVIELR